VSASVIDVARAVFSSRRGQPWQQCRESAGQGCVTTPDPLTITNFRGVDHG